MFLLYGVDGGLFMRVSLTTAVVIALGFFAVEAAASRLWLVRFRYGPVEWVWRQADFQPSEFHRSSDTPFVRDFVAHTGVDHTEIVLESRELADPHLSRTVVQASDFPRGIPPGVARINKLH
jgi:Protein of unknown function (DUF418)